MPFHAAILCVLDYLNESFQRNEIDVPLMNFGLFIYSKCHKQFQFIFYILYIL
jgi:hypothetical protein